MNYRILTGAFAMAISLAIAGAAITAGSISVPTGKQRPDFRILQPIDDETSLAPIRSALINDVETNPPGDINAPRLVRISGINLTASVQSVGVDEKNEFDVPAAETVGWYKFGSAPGEAGSTVLAAHVDYAGKRGAFFNLARVEIGDLLEVEMDDGSVHGYQVVDNVLYDKTELPASELFRRSGDPVLQLITCGGTFDEVQRSYRGNVVVTAIPVAT